MKPYVIPGDLANHACYGVLVFTAVSGLTAALGAPQYARPAGVLAALVVGGLTEARQAQLNRRAVAAGQPPTHSVEGRDVVATGLGAAVCWLAAELTEI